MRLQFSRQSDLDIDRFYTFLVENQATIKAAERAILTIKSMPNDFR